MSLQITAYQNRVTKELIIFSGVDENGSVVQPALAAGSKIRIKIGRAGQNIIDLVSGVVLAGGTKVTPTNPSTLTICGQDFSGMMPGIYDIEALVVDSADNNKTKMADEGVFILQATQGGNIG